MKKLVLFAVGMMSACLASGTPQKPDWLFINGEKYELNSNPLEEYFEAHPEMRPQQDLASTSTNLWRGYVASFEIREGQLSVKDVKIEVRSWWSSYQTRGKSVLKQVFPSRESRRVDWFSGILILPMGELRSDVHMGYASVYEKYRLLYLRKGLVKASIVFTTDEYLAYKRLQFEQFRKTERFKLTWQRHKSQNPDSTEREFDDFMFIFDPLFPCDTILDFKDFKPNQPLVPTTPAVTPAAAAAHH